MRKYNFKWCVYVLICAVIMPFLCVIVAPNEKALASSDFNIVQSENKVTSITGDFTGIKVESSEDAYDALNNFKEEFNYSESRGNLTFLRKTQSVTGSVYRFSQKHKGYEVYGGEVILNVNSDGRILSVNGCYYKDLTEVKINYSQKEAEEVINSTYSPEELSFLEENIVPEAGGCLAYVFEAKMLDDIYKVFVSAENKEIIKLVKATPSLTDAKLSELPSLSEYTKEDATTTYIYDDGSTTVLNIDKYVNKTKQEYFYVLGDSERAIYILDGYNQKDVKSAEYYATYSESAAFDTEIAVKAYDYIMQCYDFYLDSSNFGVSIDGLTNPKGEDILLLAIVHYDKNYENAAFYLPSDSATTGYFYFGDGYSLNGTGSFVNGLDVVGHEYQHCITDSIVQLEYFNESGAICEAYSDIFGACVEGYELTDSNFWTMGEDIYISDDYFRDMSNPSKTNCTYSYNNLYPLCTSNTCAHTNCDNGGVHYNSTLMTYATYIMYKQDVEFFTKETILKLWYQTLTKLSEKSTFIEFAELMLQSANELGFPEENLLDVEFAFASIDLPGYTGIKVWGDNNLQYLQGSGTIAYPYLINSVADLASVAYYVNVLEDQTYTSARYQVNVDLNLNNIPWVGIGTETNPFNGVFNGGGKTISGLNLQATSGDKYAGLFNYTGTSSYIYDIRIGQGNVTTEAEYVGSVVGLLQGTISGCSSKLNITGDKVGGIAGLVINASGGEKVVNSYTSGNLTGNIVGGLIADFSSPVNESVKQHLSGYVTSSYTTGSLSGSIVGGLVGRANGIYIANVLTTSQISLTSQTLAVGGLVGQLAAKDIVNGETASPDIVKNMILSAKVAVTIDGESSLLKQGLLVGEVLIVPSNGNLYVENTFAKKQQELGFFNVNVTSGNYILVKDSEIVKDEIYEGAFDFDNAKYFKDASNWTILEGIEAFDLVSTFKISGTNLMPEFVNSDFWLNHAASGFDSGLGTQESPYIIKTAEQLALLAKLVGSNYYNNYYSNKYYTLGADIDLSGKIWVGIGATYINVVNGVSSTKIYPFTGVFDGAGYSILNMNALSAYSVSPINSTGSNYQLTEYLPALFGVTSANSQINSIVNPVIKNVNIEDINNRGSYAASVVSKAYVAIDLENINVINGNISSSFIAGGLIGSIEGLSDTFSLTDVVSNVVNCKTQLNISGKAVGGVVGYITNASSSFGSTLNVVNYLNQGKISTTGEDIDSAVANNSIYYYRPMAGGIVGLSLIKNINVINSINVGEIVSYSNGGYIGGYIGALGLGGAYASKTMNILIDGCKQIGLIRYIFDNAICSGGNIIGGTHSELACSITITVTDKTYSNQDISLIANDNTLTGMTIDSNINISTSEIGSEDYNLYSVEYFSNSKYFNEQYYWDEELRSRLLTTITFRDYQGNVLGVIYLQVGDTEISAQEAPVPDKIVTAQYEYVFSGWDRDLTNLTSSTSVYAEYTTNVRKFTVTYIDSEGGVVEAIELEYGSSVNQDVAAPEKKGGLLYDYEFVRWGAENQTVTGQMEISPIYKLKINTSGKIVIIALIISILMVAYSTYKKKKEYMQ